MKTIAIDKQPNQKFVTRISNKDISLEFLTRGLFLYASIKVEDEYLLSGVICLNETNLIPYPNTKITGKLYFKDTQGNDEPVWSGLGERWILVYEE